MICRDNVLGKTTYLNNVYTRNEEHKKEKETYKELDSLCERKLEEHGDNDWTDRNSGGSRGPQRFVELRE